LSKRIRMCGAVHDCALRRAERTATIASWVSHIAQSANGGPATMAQAI